MFIRVKELELHKIEFDENIPPGSSVLDLGPDLRLSTPLLANGRAELIEEHRGGKNIVQDIRVVGSISTEVEVRCARCVEAVRQPLKNDFDLLYRPQGVDAHGEEASINEAETEIGYYEGEGLLLEDVLKEQILLTAPVKVVCSEDCKGLCPECGRNWNTETCECTHTMADPRWAALEDIRKKLDK